jgi:hypothetical protein
MTCSGCTHTSSTFQDAHFAQVHQRRQHIEHLEDQITELAAHVDAAMFRLLDLVREYDECEGWGGKGLISSATAPALPYLLHPCSRVPTGSTGSVALTLEQRERKRWWRMH